MQDPDTDSAPNSSTLLTGTFKQAAELPFLPIHPYQDPSSIYPPILIWTNKYTSQGNIWPPKHLPVSQVFELVPIICLLIFRRKSLRLTNAQSSRKSPSSVSQPGRAQSVFLKKTPPNISFFCIPGRYLEHFLWREKSQNIQETSKSYVLSMIHYILHHFLILYMELKSFLSNYDFWVHCW